MIYSPDDKIFRCYSDQNLRITVFALPHNRYSHTQEYIITHLPTQENETSVCLSYQYQCDIIYAVSFFFLTKYKRGIMIKKFRDSKWALALVPTIVGALLTLIIDCVKKINLFSTMVTVMKTLWSWIVRFLSFEVQVWWILAALLLLILILWIVAKIADVKGVAEPVWMKYTEDRFIDWKWSWKWEKNYLGSYQVSDLMAHCPKCNTPMRHDDYDTVFHCPRCLFESRKHSDNRNDILVVIYDNAKKMESNY